MRNGKAILILIMFSMAGMFCSCGNEMGDDIQPQGIVVYDPLYLTKWNCYPMDDSDLWLFKNAPAYYNHPGQDWDFETLFGYVPELTHRPMDYENMRILFNTRCYVPDNIQNPNEEESKRLERYYQIVRNASEQLSKFMTYKGTGRIDTINDGNNVGVSNDCRLYTVRLMDASIIADRLLFGQKPGTDLSDHFMVEGPSFRLPKGSLTDFSFEYWYDEAPVVRGMREYFVKNTWLQPCYAFWLRDIPEETYEEVTFTVTLHTTFDYWASYYRYDLDKLKQEDISLSASCTIHFGQLSDFRDKYPHYYNPSNESGLSWIGS